MDEQAINKAALPEWTFVAQLASQSYEDSLLTPQAMLDQHTILEGVGLICHNGECFDEVLTRCLHKFTVNICKISRLILRPAFAVHHPVSPCSPFRSLWPSVLANISTVNLPFADSIFAPLFTLFRRYIQ
jgi:hypothetical protein